MSLDVRQIEEERKFDLNRRLGIKDVASELEKLGDEVEVQLNLDEIKETWTQKILEGARAGGDKISEESAKAAVNLEFERMHTFSEPEKNLSYGLAGAYVARRKIAKGVGIPAAVILGAALVVNTASNAIHSARLRAHERFVEAKVQYEYQLRQKFGNEINVLLSDAEKEGINGEDSAKLVEIARIAKGRFKETDEFFEKYCRDGTAGDDVTRENYLEAEQQVPIVEDKLRSVGRNIEEGRGIINFQRDIAGTRNNLEAVIREIRHTSPPKVFSQRAESVYLSGIACLEKRQLEQAKSYGQQLRGIKGDAQDFSVLPTEAENTYMNIKGIAKEKEAIELAEKLYQVSKADIQALNVPGLKRDVQELGDLNHTLGLEYLVRIVNRKGVKSGIDRYYSDEKGKRAPGFYVIVEAFDSRGNNLNRKIRNEEDGRTYDVEMWGERVPEFVYKIVKKDKMDDGLIQNDIFGKKERGYLRERVLFKGMEGAQRGQITEW